jgi:TonB family protein
MAAPIQALVETEPLAERNMESRPLSFGVAWESPWSEFQTSLRSFVSGPRPLGNGEPSGNPLLRIQWVRGKLPARAFAVSCLWHVAAVGILLLPIWSMLPSTRPNLAPVRIELEWAGMPQDLPPISSPGPASKPSPPADPLKPRGADAFHPRQTILSTPVNATHPRQTLIQPNAPPTPPKIEPQMPNVVEWGEKAPQPNLQLPVSAKAAEPRVRQRNLQDIAAPDVANLEKNPGPLNIAATPVVNPQPQFAVSPMAAPIAASHATQAEAAAPEISSDPSPGDASLHRLIALSATPAPPAPEISVPQGNLSARLSISPEGAQRGGSGGSGSGSSGGGGANSPSGVSISGGSNHAGNGGTASAGNRSASKLVLKPMPSVSELAASSASVRNGPATVGKIDPSMPPEKILSGKEVFTLYINMPNLTSTTGSWLLNFSEFNELASPVMKPEGALSGPVPMRKVDPKYPPAAINAHIDGEIVLYAIIRKDGSVDSIQVVRSLDPQLDMNSMQALAQWKFQPATRKGEPVELETVVHIPFHFRSPD